MVPPPSNGAVSSYNRRHAVPFWLCNASTTCCPAPPEERARIRDVFSDTGLGCFLISGRSDESSATGISKSGGRRSRDSAAADSDVANPVHSPSTKEKQWPSS